MTSTARAIFNVEQYANDPRLAQAHFLCHRMVAMASATPASQPADLIAAFGTPGATHEVDRPGPAGFTDAIAGWDFVDDDNDPYDAVHYGHGTGTAEDATAAASTLAQEVGACPTAWSCRSRWVTPSSPRETPSPKAHSSLSTPGRR